MLKLYYSLKAEIFAFTATVVATATATARATTNAAVFAFQDDYKHGQNRTRSATNYCRSLMAHRQNEKIGSSKGFLRLSKYRSEP